MNKETGDDGRSRADAEARELIQLKRTERDPERMRSVLRDWLVPRISPRGSLAVSPMSLPDGTGVANETLMFDATWSAEGRDTTEGFVVRIASSDPLYLGADISVHHDVYEALADVEGVPVPRVYGFEPDPSLLGAPFIVMERKYGRVPGDQPSWVTSGFVVEATPKERRAMWDNSVAVLAALHRADASRFHFLLPRNDLSGLADHLAYWRRWLDDPSTGAMHDTVEQGYAWLTEHLPAMQPTALSWGDSRFANIMFDGTRVAAIFDWDTVSLAGPGADLGWWRFMDGLDGIGTADHLVERWQDLSGMVATDIEFYDVFTTFRLSAILMRLFGQMGRAGTIPSEVAEQQARNSAPVQALAAQLLAFR